MFEALKAGLIALPLLLALLVALAAVPGEESETSASIAITVPAFDCATGEAAENQQSVGGLVSPRRELLDTIAEAEVFLCVDLPGLPAEHQWTVTGVNAIRSHSLSRFEAGAWTAGDDAYKYAETYYANAGMDAFASLIVRPVDYEERTGIGILCAPAGASPADVSDVTIAGVKATLWTASEPVSTGPGATVCWQRQGLFFYAAFSFEPGFDVESEVLPVLEAIE